MIINNEEEYRKPNLTLKGLFKAFELFEKGLQIIHNEVSNRSFVRLNKIILNSLIGYRELFEDNNTVKQSTFDRF